jgi:hypothetical protein
MAVTKTLTIGSTTNQRPYGVLTVTETATSTANNTSTLSIKLVLKRPSSISSTATKSASCTINGTKYTFSGSIGGSGDKTLISKTQTVTHNSDGSKTINISAEIALNITWSGVSLGTISNSGTMTLTKIPRYATVSQSLSAKTETTATIKWTSDATVDYIWWSSNNGSSWTGINVTDGTSGSYTISGLSANTAYNIKTRVRRKDSQLTTDSSALSVTTYAYPYANSMPSFTIGSKLTIGIFNPLKRSVRVNIIGADGSQISDDTTTGTSITGYAGDVVVNRLYASIPNAKSGRYQVKVTYGSQITTKNGGTYSINENVCLPSIGGGAYQDTDSSVVAITGNNQDIVRNQSVVRYTASGLTAQKSASIASCKVVVNGNTYNLTVSGTNAVGGNAKINSGMDVEAVFTVTDSRGLTASKTITVHMLDWHVPSAIIFVQRQNNYYSETDINVDAEYPSINGNNTIAITYEATKDGDSAPSVSGSLQDDVTSVAVLDKDFAWTIAITLVDRFGGRTTYRVGISRGMPIIYFDRLLSSVGINCFPKDEKSLEVDGFNMAKSIMTRSMSQAMTDLAVNTYTIIPFDLTNSVGGKLTATNDGGIEIGSGVSKILVSGMLSYDTINSTGSRHVRIIKNSYNADNTLAWSWQTLVQNNPAQVEVMPILADVEEGDIIYMLYYTGNANDKIGGNAYGCRTSLTVEVVG